MEVDVFVLKKPRINSFDGRVVTVITRVRHLNVSFYRYVKSFNSTVFLGLVKFKFSYVLYGLCCFKRVSFGSLQKDVMI